MPKLGGRFRNGGRFDKLTPGSRRGSRAADGALVLDMPQVLANLPAKSVKQARDWLRAQAGGAKSTGSSKTPPIIAQSGTPASPSAAPGTDPSATPRSSSTPAAPVAGQPYTAPTPAGGWAQPEPLRELPPVILPADERAHGERDAGRPTAELIANIDDLMIGANGIPAAQTRLRELADQYEAGFHSDLSFRTAAQRMLGNNPDFVKHFDFGAYYEHYYGPHPESGGISMYDPHAHHILFKEGTDGQKELSIEGQEILRGVGIDPIFGLENLIWAPNRVIGQHSKTTLEGVVTELRTLSKDGASRGKFVKKLRELGDQAQKRTTTNTYIDKDAPKQPRSPKAPTVNAENGENPSKKATRRTTTEKPVTEKPSKAKKAKSETGGKPAKPANNGVTPKMTTKKRATQKPS